MEQADVETAMAVQQKKYSSFVLKGIVFIATCHFLSHGIFVFHSMQKFRKMSNNN